MKTSNLLLEKTAASRTRLNVSEGLTAFPNDILKFADTVEILDLSNNHLSTLPDEFAQFQNLKAVFFNNNEFEVFPEVLTQCPHLSMISFKANRLRHIDDQALSPNLRWLTLTDNQLQALPASMGKLSRLQKLMLAGNQLQTLPSELAACHNLELIRLAANCLTELPPWLLELPRLSWLAYSGNPCCPAPIQGDAAIALPEIAWSELTMGETLGEGASGVIYKGTWHTQPQPMDIAVKIFKGQVTSDGLPADEMCACITAGSHPNLVPVLGKLSSAPNCQEGLVFAFIPPDYANLGNPPSLQSCTRDTYASDTTFSLSVILKTAMGITSVAAHLHERGIMHGDLYPHNTLMTQMGDCLLGDFGAASFYASQDQSIASAFERLEVRAFGCLLEDMLDRCTSIDRAANTDTIDRLWQLQCDCVTPVPAQRPLFREIGERLLAV